MLLWPKKKLNKKRLPLLLWGDLQENAPPILRRSLAGNNAHECMYAWVYLTDFLAVNSLTNVYDSSAEEKLKELRLFPSLDIELWKLYPRGVIDPHFQLNTSSFESIAYLFFAAQVLEAEDSVTITELGSTFFVLKDKYELILKESKRLKIQNSFRNIRWLGIDNSSFMNKTARLLHPGQDNISIIDNYLGYANKKITNAVFHSRFVCSYAYQSTEDLVMFLKDNFQAFVIEDAFSTLAEDVRVYNHGQSEVFFNLDYFIPALDRCGFKVYMIDHYPDFPADTAPCHVLKLFAHTFSESTFEKEIKSKLDGLGFDVAHLKQVNNFELRASLNNQINCERWHEIKNYKHHSPVWGRTSVIEKKGLFARIKQRVLNYVDNKSPWMNYKMQSDTIKQEINRAIEQEKY